MGKFYSPLRYPGGKTKLADFAKILIAKNGIENGLYAEVFAGGSGVALSLLIEGFVSRIIINDLDKNIYSFWEACVNHNSELRNLITSTEVTMDEWHKQRDILNDEKSNLIERAFATFFLNRTNRSGIITGGVIGGLEQDGNYDIEARYTKPTLLKRIKKIGKFSDRIEVTRYDALEFIDEYVTEFTPNSLTYFDPPYYVKGSSNLYSNYFVEGDHVELKNKIAQLDQNWFLSYDNVSEIREMYSNYRSISYGLNYSAQKKYEGKEIIFFSDALDYPEVNDPAKVKFENEQDLSFTNNG